MFIISILSVTSLLSPSAYADHLLILFKCLASSYNLIGWPFCQSLVIQPIGHETNSATAGLSESSAHSFILCDSLVGQPLHTVRKAGVDPDGIWAVGTNPPGSLRLHILSGLI